MRKHEIKVGGLYLAKVSGQVTTVRVDSIVDSNVYGPVKVRYNVTNLRTGRRCTFESAAKFRGEAKADNLAQNGPPATDTSDLARASLDTKAQATLESALIENYTLDEEGEECPDPTPIRALGVASPSMATTTTPAGAALSIGGTIAGRIAAARQGRTPGTAVAGMTPSDEQEAVLSAAEARGLKVLVIGAGAGCGKTATLKMLEQVLTGRGQYTAFNRSLVNDARGKFKKARCNTTHSLAFHAVGKRFEARLDSERMRSGQVARILGIQDYPVTLPGMGAPDEEGKPTDKVKVLSREFLAGQVQVAVRKFCQSADREIGGQHFNYIDGIDTAMESQDEDGTLRKKRSRANNDMVRAYLLLFAAKAWADLCDVEGTLPYNADCYVKLWQLGTGDDRPIIGADYILLDEYQDTAPVFLDVLMQQKHALLVLVGDDNQRIYEWRGAVNAGDAFPDAPKRMLSQSYRFGQAVADVANAVLATLEVPTELVMRGNPAIQSRVEEVDSPRCYLYRTNAGAVGQVMASIEEDKRPHLIGGGDDVVRWMQAAMDLQARPPRKTQHPELACFDNWAEVVEYSKSDEGSDLKLMVKLVETFGAEEIRDALRGMPKEEDADLVISTAHKSKGREWETVALGPDFPLANKMTDSDRRLLYVAATRAQLVLDITKCPPFCGGQDGRGEDTRWVPGIEVAFTTPAPIVERCAEVAHNVGINDSGKMATEPAPKAAVGFTWANHNGRWLVRGPIGMKVPTEVGVRKRDGSVTPAVLKKVVHRYDDTWLYGT